MLIDFSGLIKTNKNTEYPDNYIPNLGLQQFSSKKIETDFFKLTIHYKKTSENFYYNENGVWILSMGKILFRDQYTNEISNDNRQGTTLSKLYKLYLDKNRNLVEFIKGSFLLLILDTKSEKYYFFNDRIGFYDLFYQQNSTGLYFSTDLLAFKQLFKLKDKQDSVSLLQHFLFDYPLGEYSYLKNTKKLLSGSYLLNRKSKTTFHQYNSFLTKIIEPSTLSWNETQNLIPGVFNSATKSIIDGTRNICSGLTSGFDSRANLSSLEKIGSKNVLYYSWGLPKSIEIEIAKEIANTLKLNYKHISLAEVFENEYEQYAHQSVLLSNGKAPISRANHAYGYSILSSHSNLFFTGIAGSELLKPRNCSGYMFTQLYLNLLYANSTEQRIELLEESLLSLNYIHPAAIFQNKEELINRTIDYFKDYDGIIHKHLRLYYFMLKDGFNNYFGHEIHTNRIYGHIMSPYLDDEFISFILSTPIPDLNQHAFKNNLRSKIKGSQLYNPIMKNNLPELMNIETGRYFKPKDLESKYVYFHLFIAYLKKKTSPNYPTFDSARWTQNLMKKYSSDSALRNELFTEDSPNVLKHKNAVKIYSIKYYLSQFNQ